jgi:hypothetical protein
MCKCCGTCKEWDGDIRKSEAYCKSRPKLPFWMSGHSSNGYVGRNSGKGCKAYKKDPAKCRDVRK